MGVTHTIDLESLTVLAVDADGEPHDLNAEGEPCRSPEDLRGFVRELCEQGAYGVDVCDDLLAQIASEKRYYEELDLGTALTTAGCVRAEELGLRIDVDAYGLAYACNDAGEVIEVK